MIFVTAVAFSVCLGAAWGEVSQNVLGQASNEELTGAWEFHPGQENQVHSCPAIRAHAPTHDSILSYTGASVACPQAEGKLYQSQDGATFLIQCCSKASLSPMATVKASSFTQCMEKCSGTKMCHSIQYAVDESTSECQLYTTGRYSAPSGETASTMHNYAFIIDPPAISSPDHGTILCSKQCPFADGQQFTTSAGEVFVMDCAKRHGTKVIYQDSGKSFEECVEACGELVPCHSVDYDTARKICYYGNHHGPPTISAPTFASAHSLGCGRTCDNKRCSGPKKPTCKPPTCAPGIQRSFYDNIFKNFDQPNYPIFKPEAFKNQQAEKTDVVQDISFHNTEINGPLSFKAIMYFTYLYACESGEYTFASDAVDDIAVMWFGDKAMGDYTRENADLIQTWSGNLKVPQQVKKHVSAGTYYPIRIWFGDQGGAASLKFKILGPGGDELTGRPAGQSYFSTKPCNEQSPVLTSPTPPEPKFECGPEAYLIQFNTLYKVDLKTGQKETISDKVGSGKGAINSLGFNTQDNLLYGNQGNNLIRILGDGSTEQILELPFPPNLGDFDDKGQYWFSNGGTKWGRVDLSPGSPTYGQVVEQGVSSVEGISAPADWAYTPASPGYLYGIGVAPPAQLVSWSMKTKTWKKEYDAVGVNAKVFGGVMPTRDGVIYGTDNESGKIYRFQLGNSSAREVATGPAASSNDATRCFKQADL